MQWMMLKIISLADVSVPLLLPLWIMLCKHQVNEHFTLNVVISGRFHPKRLTRETEMEANIKVVEYVRCKVGVLIFQYLTVGFDCDLVYKGFNFRIFSFAL